MCHTNRFFTINETHRRYTVTRSWQFFLYLYLPTQRHTVSVIKKPEQLYSTFLLLSLPHDFENWPSYNAALVSIDFTSHHSVFRSLCSCSVPFRSLWLHVVWWRSCDVKWYGSNYFLLHSIWTQRCPGDIRKLPIPSFVHGSLNRASGRSHLHLLHTPPWGLQNSDKNLPSSWDSVTTM